MYTCIGTHMLRRYSALQPLMAPLTSSDSGAALRPGSRLQLKRPSAVAKRSAPTLIDRPAGLGAGPGWGSIALPGRVRGPGWVSTQHFAVGVAR